MELLSDSIGFQINLTARSLRTALEKRLSDVGITPTQWMIMMVLGEKNSLNQTDLSKRLNLDPTTITHNLDKLENLNLLQRNQDKDDRRTQNVSLTNKGVRSYVEWMRLGEEVNRIAAEGLNSEDRTRFIMWLNRVYSNLTIFNGK
ncbi:MAG: MarR family transcriptional regulator [FCB group bacterium]|nr:MarR family transcriptional regulator [FCB group bacterium]